MTADAGSTDRRLDVLVLGGTSWLGGAVVRHALARGHHVTCLARGESGAVPEGAELVPGDRNDESAYDTVANRDWDVVVDVARQPVHVRGAVDALASRVRHWVFVSTGSVYAHDRTPGEDESALLHDPWQGEGLAGMEEYGPAKVACEQAVLDVFPDALIARAGLIIGYGDRSDRFGYWPARVARAADQEPVLVPSLEAPCQVIDVEDLAAWLVLCGETRRGGTANAVGPVTTFRDLLEACSVAAGASPRWVEADDAWLGEHGVEPWMGPESMPLWLPAEEYGGFMTRSVTRAQSLGLTVRPLVESAGAALAWERELGLDRERHAGLSAGRERELLAAREAIST